MSKTTSVPHREFTPRGHSGPAPTGAGRNVACDAEGSHQNVSILRGHFLSSRDITMCKALLSKAASIENILIYDLPIDRPQPRLT